MTATTWTIDSNQSDVLLKARHSHNTYLANSINQLNGSIAIKDNELEDASVDFLIDINAKKGKLAHLNTSLKLEDFGTENQPATISFKSISFEKVNSNINFLKGYLTINNITKVVELDAILNNLETKNGEAKAVFEIIGKINRKDFGLSYNTFKETDGISLGQEINLIANFEFSTHALLN